MRVGLKIGLVAGAALMAGIGFSQAAPLAGLAAAGASIKIVGEPSAPEAVAEKTDWRRRYHRHYHYHHRYHHHY
jgi:hypothetical protein